MQANIDDLKDIKDVGQVTAGSVVSYFKDNISLINELKNIGINMDYKGKNAGSNDLVTGKKFVITGTISGIGRKEIKEKLESYNAKFSEAVSKNTDIVIVGENPGSKYQEAQRLNIPIWNEEKLKEVLNNLQ